MNIKEATMLSFIKDTAIYRKKWMKEYNCEIAIVPTNSPDCCVVKRFENGKEVSRGRCWNPQLEDLIEDDWELFDEKKLRKPEMTIDKMYGWINKALEDGCADDLIPKMVNALETLIRINANEKLFEEEGTEKETMKVFSEPKYYIPCPPKPKKGVKRNFYEEISKFAKRERDEIAKEKKKHRIQVCVNPDSLIGKEIMYQTALLHEILHELKKGFK